MSQHDLVHVLVQNLYKRVLLLQAAHKIAHPKCICDQVAQANADQL